ncbi:uncharacterized protein [Nothobranchius furzeri]|uniref:uncharacterized protein isoform X1 n=1 Tax=Nothobranchius furzeri TaxID=105023 RepID=UPI00390480BF
MDQNQQEAQTGSIREVARNLMVLLNAHLQAEGPPQQTQTVPQRTTPPPQQTIPRSTVNQEMSRSFPGLFSRNSARGRKRFFSPSRVVTSTNGKSVTVTFFLLHQNTDKTPKASTELTLILAGMGRRAVTFPESADHTEISGLLTTHYPKLERLTGGWLLYKALGGSGQRKLSLIPPEAEGYNGSLLKSVTGGGKNMIYVIPLQEELDTSPLPPDALEFQSMPKASCKVCSATMPLHVLAVHVKSCVDLISSGDDFETSNEVIIFCLLSLFYPSIHFHPLIWSRVVGAVT